VSRAEAPSVFVSKRLSQQLVTDLQNSLSPSTMIPALLHEHVQMIGSFGKLARSSSDTRIICNVDLQKGRLPRLSSRISATALRPASRFRAPDEDLKSLSRELTRHLVANPFICARN
jgi:hypothetical protein